MSRSVTVAVAYIMCITNLSWKDALKVVRVGRAVANPNIGFQQQLQDFESSRLQEVRRSFLINLSNNSLMWRSNFHNNAILISHTSHLSSRLSIVGQIPDICSQERRRLKERFPSMALTANDVEACSATLQNYETFVLAKEVCEGKCAMGRACPTGLCRQPSKRSQSTIHFYRNFHNTEHSRQYLQNNLANLSLDYLKPAFILSKHLTDS